MQDRLKLGLIQHYTLFITLTEHNFKRFSFFNLSIFLPSSENFALRAIKRIKKNFEKKEKYLYICFTYVLLIQHVYFMQKIF